VLDRCTHHKRTANLCAQLATAFLFAAIAGVPDSAAAQDCLSVHPELLFDTSSDCDARPNNPKVYGLKVIAWQGHDYLLANNGNGLQMWNIDDPTSPQPHGTVWWCTVNSTPLFPHGDLDHNLYNFTVCDDCRFGSANFSNAGSVLFDLGTGATPVLSTTGQYCRGYPDIDARGSFTFRHNGQQYLIMTDDIDVCQGDAALYLFDTIEKEQLTFLQCVTDAQGNAFLAYGGFYVPHSDIQEPEIAYLYIFDQMKRGHILEANGSSTSLTLSYLSQPLLGAYIRGEGVALDRDHDLAVTSSNLGTTLYDISTPDQPTEITSVPNSVSMNLASIAYPYLWVGTTASVDARTFDISDPNNPVELDPDFWDPSQTWNSQYDCTFNQDSAFSRDGDVLFLSRHSVLQAISFHACATDPDAGVFDASVDAGSSDFDASTDAGTPDAAAHDGSPSDATGPAGGSGDSGCGCRTATGPKKKNAPWLGWLLILLVGGLVVHKRRPLLDS
jgi:MYXO-CTERM domain-containing protein